MNPFTIIEIIVASIEGAAGAANPKRREAAKKEQRRCLFAYWCLLVLGMLVTAWAVHALYF